MRRFQIILRMRKVSSGPLLSINTFCYMQWSCWRTVKALSRLPAKLGILCPRIRIRCPRIRIRCPRIRIRCPRIRMARSILLSAYKDCSAIWQQRSRLLRGYLELSCFAGSNTTNTGKATITKHGLSEASITKTGLFKYTESFTTKKMKIFRYKFWYFSYFCSKHGLWVLVRTASPRRF